MCASEAEVRLPVCAGTWYPGKETELRSLLKQLLSSHRNENPDRIRAIISPHAGYAYSGHVAAAAYAQLKNDHNTVFLLGPSHYSRFMGISILSVGAYRTPLGDVPLSPVIKNLLKSGIVNETPSAHSREHSLELQLPFLQYCLGEFDVVPILVDEVEVNSLVELLDKNVGDNDLIVVSVDLSHFHPEGKAHELDGSALECIKKLDSEAILSEEIDAPRAVSALLQLADVKGWKPELMKYATSADSGGGRDRVVGYSSFIFS